ncbi:MAG TPA: TIM barrel protein [Kineosporiaceae bacterium]
MAKIPLADRFAGAPISWGVCEAPGWGHELPADRVLADMGSLGLRATELGPTGYLGPDPDAVRATLDRHGLRLVGGFLPLPLHLDGVDLTEAVDAMRTLAAAGGEIVVLAARSLGGGYDRKVRLSDGEWRLLAENLARVREVAHSLGLRSCLHPHVGTAVEDAESVDRLVDLSDVPLCIDTGHLLIGGTDPLDLVRRHPDRVGHVHLKDVNASVADKVSASSVSYLEAVREGLYTPLGDGDLDILAIIRVLEEGEYQGWYVLEQDTALAGPPVAGAGPIDDVRRSLLHLKGVIP